MMTPVILLPFRTVSNEKLGRVLGTRLILGLVVQPGSNLRWLVFALLVRYLYPFREGTANPS